MAKATHAFLVEEVFAASEPPVLNCLIKFRRPWPPTSHKHWPSPWSLMSMFFPPPALTLFFSAVTGFCEYYRTCTMCCRRLRLHHNEIHAILKSFVRGCSPDSFWLSSHELHWLTVLSNPKFLSLLSVVLTVSLFDSKATWECFRSVKSTPGQGSHIQVETSVPPGKWLMRVSEYNGCLVFLCLLRIRAEQILEEDLEVQLWCCKKEPDMMSLPQ